MSDPKQQDPNAQDGTGDGHRRLVRDEYRLVSRTVSAFPGGRPDGAVVAAVSGGCDSMALLELLADAAAARTAGRARFRLFVAYVDHGQRAAAAREAALVAAAAQRRGAEFACLRPRPGLPPDASEAAMRSARYHALERFADRVGGRWIATGHTRDDQVETVLMRLLRGSGRLGLAGIRPHNGRIVRPLLDSERCELEAYLRARGVGWVNDASNASPRYTRNRLRHIVLPTIEREIGSGSLRHLPDVAARMRIEEDYLAEQARRFARYAICRGVRSESEVDLVALERVPAALRGRVLRDWFAGLPGAQPLSIAQIGELERLAAGRAGTLAIHVAGLVLEREYERLRLAVPNDRADAFAFAVPTEHASHVEGPCGRWRLTVDPRPSGPPCAARSLYREEWDLAAAAVEGPLMLRPAAAGDTIVRSGRGAGKVRDIMVDLRVPRSARRDWPVLVDGARIMWVPGVAVAADAGDGGVGGRRVRFGWHRTR